MAASRRLQSTRSGAAHHHWLLNRAAAIIRCQSSLAVSHGSGRKELHSYSPWPMGKKVLLPSSSCSATPWLPMRSNHVGWLAGGCCSRGGVGPTCTQLLVISLEELSLWLYFPKLSFYIQLWWFVNFIIWELRLAETAYCSCLVVYNYYTFLLGLCKFGLRELEICKEKCKMTILQGNFNVLLGCYTFRTSVTQYLFI